MTLSLPRFQDITRSVTALVLVAAPIFGQAPQTPYAAIDRNAVNYAGPGRDAAEDLVGPEIKIGLLAPLSGPRRAEGESLLQAVELALQDEDAKPLPDSRRLALAARDENGPWGRAASEVVHLVMDDRAIALITSSSGGAAHLAEQVANKIGVPVLTLSADSTTTQINLPWIFRLGPTEREEAREFAKNIYLHRRLKRVVLVTDSDHDGRVGSEDFEKVAREFSPDTIRATVPVRVAADGTVLNAPSVVQGILAEKPEALIFWTGPETAAELVGPIRASQPSVPIYLCRKATQGKNANVSRKPCPKCPEVIGGVWTVAGDSPAGAARANFERRLQERTPSAPSVAAAQAYDAVRLIAAALRKAGPNRARLRDALAETQNFPGTSGLISFDHAGNDLSTVTLVTLR